MESRLDGLAGIEQTLSERMGGSGVTVTMLPACAPDSVPVMRITFDSQEELPVFVTASPTQVLCICYLWTEDEIKPERRAEMLEAMMDLNISIPLSNFGRIGERYVIYGSLAQDARMEDVATDVAMVADNAIEALEVFTEFLK